MRPVMQSNAHRLSNKARVLLPLAVECIQLALQLFEFLSSFAQFSLRGQALIVFKISRGALDKSVEIV